jgi:hypothetical protein
MSAGPQGPQAPDAIKKDVATAPEVIAAVEINQEVARINAEALLAKKQNELTEKEAAGTARETELERLRNFEIEKINLSRKFELEKANDILKADEQKKVKATINAKADLKIIQAQGKIKAKTRQQELKQESDFWNMSASLASSGNKTLAAIGKTFGLLQIAQKTPTAVANSYEFGTRVGGPILGAVFGGVAGAAMAAQAAQLAGVKGFATGGVIGGFQGSTLGSDNQIATVRKGEMVLSGNEQKNMFGALQSGNLGGGNEALMAALSQPIIIQVDNREIARANRTAIQEGFAAA